MIKQHVFFVKNTIFIHFFFTQKQKFCIFFNFTSAISCPRDFICEKFLTVVHISFNGELFRTFERYDGDNWFSPLTI